MLFQATAARHAANQAGDEHATKAKERVRPWSGLGSVVVDEDHLFGVAWCGTCVCVCEAKEEVGQFPDMTDRLTATTVIT